MQRSTGLFPIFFFLLCISVLLFIFSKFGILTGINGVVQIVTTPLRHIVFADMSAVLNKTPSPMDKLQTENNLLIGQMAREKELEMDNQALLDQFQTSSPAPEDLLPAQIIGFSGFIPGMSPINAYILNVGLSNSVEVGDAVIYKNNLIGIVEQVSQHIASVSPITSGNVSLTGQTLKSQALGIISGSGNTQTIFGNVVLSDTLSVNDLVVTKGDIDQSGQGVPPGLVVGKIVSIDKKTSALFQSAQLQSLVDLTNLSTVFVLHVK